MQDVSVGDPRFYPQGGPFGIAEVARAAGGDAAESGLMLTGIAPLQVAKPGHVSFLDNRRYADMLGKTTAGAVIVHPNMQDRVPANTVSIVMKAPYEGWARVGKLFHPARPLCPGIHPTALIARGAEVDPSAEIGAFACIEDRVQIGPGCTIGAYVSLAAGVVIGRDCRISAHVSVSHALIGDRVFLHPGVRIGQEGFSFARTSTGYLTIPQLGKVIIEDDVEIGANSTVDRGSAQDTVIGAGSRIDNLVQIGHNVRLGRCCVIVAQVGISGSTILGDFVQVGGQAAMAGHLHIGDGAQIGAQAGVIADVEPGAIVIGSPAQSRQQFFRQVATLKRMTERPKKPV
ncbi:UDP-3-O-(3-hydroxymyristoyl)glucosamine N-acyltransferase [Acidisphaera sp. L21]|uniref:UDP-3-O-(3-hydroxymyristoyl)glucosamine N-acyltransferase n=1 Tax=Acidisphaera sp. L21 TaxID=1641851 RepID=UPI00131E0FA4|nr:UDP-3-O-(3-hydroxymyristoyl)glucosamine N-acyltransferase [Acidisphaera sp. L21]